MLAVLLFVAIAIRSASTKPPPSLKLSDGSTITLIQIGHGKWNVSFPDPNPLRQLLQQTKILLGLDHTHNILTRSRPVATRWGPVPQPYTNATIFWFRTETNKKYWWVKAEEDPNQLGPTFDGSTVRRQVSTVKNPISSPDIVGIVVNDCPTNTPNLHLGFYDSYAGPHDFLGGLTVKNPFYTP